MRFYRAFLPFIMAIGISGCVNPYKTTYKPVDSPPMNAIACDTPVVKRSDVEPPQIQYDMYKKGYTLLGYAEFNGGEASEAALAKHATELKACIALLMKRYTHTQTSYVPIMQYNDPQQIDIQTTGTFSGKRGNVDYTGNTTAVAPGYTTTTFVPNQERRHDYFATYWVKLPPPALGIILVNMPDDLRRKLNLEKGGLVKAIREDAPADKAGFITEDVIVGYDGIAFTTIKEFFKYIEGKAGRTIEMDLVRGGNPMKKSVTIASNN